MRSARTPGNLAENRPPATSEKIVHDVDGRFYSTDPRLQPTRNAKARSGFRTNAMDAPETDPASNETAPLQEGLESV